MCVALGMIPLALCSPDLICLHQSLVLSWRLKRRAGKTAVGAFCVFLAGEITGLGCARALLAREAAGRGPSRVLQPAEPLQRDGACFGTVSQQVCRWGN